MRAPRSARLRYGLGEGDGCTSHLRESCHSHNGLKVGAAWCDKDSAVSVGLAMRGAFPALRRPQRQHTTQQTSRSIVAAICNMSLYAKSLRVRRRGPHARHAYVYIECHAHAPMCLCHVRDARAEPGSRHSHGKSKNTGQSNPIHPSRGPLRPCAMRRAVVATAAAADTGAQVLWRDAGLCRVSRPKRAHDASRRGATSLAGAVAVQHPRGHRSSDVRRGSFAAHLGQPRNTVSLSPPFTRPVAHTRARARAGRVSRLITEPSSPCTIPRGCANTAQAPTGHDRPARQATAGPDGPTQTPTGHGRPRQAAPSHCHCHTEPPAD